MLIKCPECDLQVSDKAMACPHCGYPLTKTQKLPSTKRKPKRLPNGFGEITKITSKPLRKPYRAMITVGKTEDGQLIRKILKPNGYFETYNDAYQALLEYHKDPYVLTEDMSLNELFNRWIEEYKKTVTSKSAIKNITMAWVYCAEYYSMGIKEIRSRHVKMIIDNASRTDPKGNVVKASDYNKTKIKQILNMLFDYAIEYELVEKNYARDTRKVVKKESSSEEQAHMPFEEEELQKLWDAVDSVEYADWIIIQCYMGWRPREFCSIELCNIDVDKKLITGGMKTESGKNRTVPIHHRILPLIEKNIKDNTSGYLASVDGEPVTYSMYNHRFKNIMSVLGLNKNHKCHDTRMTFITRLKKNGASDAAIKKLAGHRETDVTEANYTKRDIEWLRKDIEKLP